MSNATSTAVRRLTELKDTIMGTTPFSIPWDPTRKSFPLLKDLPSIPGAPAEAAWVWGADDYIGRLNLLTPARVKAAAAEIKTGEMARLDLPLNVPAQPAFGRETFTHSIKTLTEGVSYDDTYHLNTQSGTQWDGFRHFSHIPTQTFYNGTKAADFVNPEGSDNLKCSIHHWSLHGFSGRAVLLDYRAWATSQGIKYDTAEPHAITLTSLSAVGKAQGIDIRPASQGGDIAIGDILLIRSGWTEDYHARSAEESATLALREHGTWAGVEQTEEMKTWLHDCYFAAVGGDAPAFECWPPAGGWFLHQYILALWGMPLGEMLDLEKASAICKRLGKWNFFFTSAPANCVGGVSSHVNGTGVW